MWSDVLSENVKEETQQNRRSKYVDMFSSHETCDLSNKDSLHSEQAAYLISLESVLSCVILDRWMHNNNKKFDNELVRDVTSEFRMRPGWKRLEMDLYFSLLGWRKDERQVGPS